MGKSTAFAGIKRDVLTITAALPPGRLTSFAAIGDYLSVLPRHVAYILATLSPGEQAQVPWHRVVGADGRLGKPRHDALGRSQALLLQAEGIGVTDGAVDAFATRFIAVAALASGVEPHKHYLASGDEAAAPQEGRQDAGADL